MSLKHWCKSGRGCLCKTSKTFADPSAVTTQMRGDSNFWSLPPVNDIVLANTSGHHSASRRQTWHYLNGQQYSQINYILMRRRFRSGVNIARTRSFPGAGIRSNHDLLMMIFRLRLKKQTNKQTKTASQNTHDSSLTS